MGHEKTILTSKRTESAIYLFRFKTVKCGTPGYKSKSVQFVLSLNGEPFLLKTYSKYNREYINTLNQGDIVFVSFWSTNRMSKEGAPIYLLHRIGKTTQELTNSRNPNRSTMAT